VISVDVRTDKVQIMLTEAMKNMPLKVERALSITAQQGINIILDRTEKGRGIKGPFARYAPYTPAYAKRKAEGWPSTKTQRAFSGDPSGIVNLNVRGEMLGAMISKSKGLTATISFARATENNKAYWNSRKRPFFGFNDKEKRTLAKVFQRAFKL
jgi:hypothetical protein